jgi:hypothetical protein
LHTPTYILCRMIEEVFRFVVMKENYRLKVDNFAIKPSM